MNVSASRDNTAWAVKHCSWRDATEIADELDIPRLLAMVLVSRGYSKPEAAREFLECSAPLPDPFLFSNMKEAVRILAAAVDEHQKIVIHGDYDADGITATALLVQGLRRVGASVDWYLPSRFNEGYGLSNGAVETIAAQGADVLVTVDCGINYPDEVARARELGLTVLVIDHHEPGPRLPECCVIHHALGEYPHGDLCGVGLALKVMHAVHIGRTGADYRRLPAELLPFLDLVAVGTVADLSALRGENRYYVKEGLKLLNLGQRVGLRALAEVAGCSGAVDSGTIAFRLAPRLNAAGRLADPTPPLRLLLTDDEQEARVLAGQLHELNGERQDLERAMFDAAKREVDSLPALPTVLVLWSSDWHEGVVGIVASRMVELYQRPTVLLCVRNGIAKGSGRSIPAYDLLSGIDACGDLLSVYGGHAQAAGLTLDADRLDDLRIRLEQHAASALSSADLLPRYEADAVLTSEDVNTATAESLVLLEPFGSGNPRPRFVMVDTLLEDPQPTRNGLHLKCRARIGGVKVQAIGFGMGSRSTELACGGACVIGAQLKVDEWQGSVRPQLVLDRIERIQEPAGPKGDNDSGDDSYLAVYGHGWRTVVESAADDAPRCGSSSDATWPVAARDLRGYSGALTTVAQIIATGETVILFTASAPRTLENLATSLPIQALGDGEPRVLGRGGEGDGASAASERVVVVEWRAAAAACIALKGWSHVVVLDPPYLAHHMSAVQALHKAGAAVHLVYGERQREATASLLRFLVHPRFAMICLYRARGEGGAKSTEGLFEAARRLAWQQARVALTDEDIARAQEILNDLGLDTPAEGKAKLDARDNAAYRKAEAHYEECIRSCLTL